MSSRTSPAGRLRNGLDRVTIRLGREIGRVRSLCADPRVAALATTAIIAIATAARFAIPFEQPRFITYYPAVALAAIFVGMWSGLVLTLLATVIAVWLFFPPAYSFALTDPLEWVSITIFFVTGCTISLVAEMDRSQQEGERNSVSLDLAASRKRQNTIIESLRDGIIEFAPDGRPIDCNASAMRILRRSRAELLEPASGHIDWEIRDVAGRPLEPDEQPLARVLATGRALWDEIVEIPVDGGTVDLLVAMTPIRDIASGEITSIVASFADITERLARKRELVESRARLESIVSSALDAIVTIDADGRILLFNEAAERMFGWKAEEVTGRDFSILVPNRHRPDHSERLHRFAAGFTDGAVMKRDLEVTVHRRDGTEVPTEASVSRVEAAGRTLFTITHRDVSERRRQERRLAERDEELRHTLAAAGLGVWWWDVATGVFHGDARSRTLFGVGATATADEAARRFATTSRTAFLDLAEAAGKPDFPGAIELEVIGEDDTVEAWLAVTARMRRTEDGHREVWGTVADVSERRRAEQALERVESNRRLEALGRMTGGIAHDFNNLLTIVSGNLQLLEGVVADGAARHWIGEALAATEAGAELNARLTTFARRRRLAPVPTDLGERVDRMIGMIRRSVGEDVLVDHIVVPPIAPVLIDAAEIETALLNLVFNARDALPNGGRITIEVAEVEIVDTTDLPAGARPGRHARLTVADDGLGMSDEVRARAFEPFFTTKPIGRGTGLGLATLHGFVRQSGGFVTLTSAPGQGTRVAVHLPCAKKADRIVAAANDGVAVTGEERTVLVVEDDAAVARVTRARLEKMGWSVVEAGDVARALEIVASGRAIDLVFSDVVMPGGLDGFDLARRLAAERPDLPVLLTTGFTAEETEIEGMPRVLKKPYDRRQLAEAITATFDDVRRAQPVDTSAVKT